MSLGPLAGMRVVDLFSGSGALGIEALSRGAEHVDFVESAAAARRILGENMRTLGIEARATIWPHVLPQGLKRISAPLAGADLILLDPPYGGELARATLRALGASDDLRVSVRVVVEHHRRDTMPESCGVLASVRARRYGETFVTTYAIRAEEAPADQGAQA